MMRPVEELHLCVDPGLRNFAWHLRRVSDGLPVFTLNEDLLGSRTFKRMSFEEIAETLHEWYRSRREFVLITRATIEIQMKKRMIAVQMWLGGFLSARGVRVSYLAPVVYRRHFGISTGQGHAANKRATLRFCEGMKGLEQDHNCCEAYLMGAYEYRDMPAVKEVISKQTSKKEKQEHGDQFAEQLPGDRVDVPLGLLRHEQRLDEEIGHLRRRTALRHAAHVQGLQDAGRGEPALVQGGSPIQLGPTLEQGQAAPEGEHSEDLLRGS
jgi:hypothetical protein